MELSDIQGLVFHPYRRLPEAAYVLLRLRQDPARVRAWLRLLMERNAIDSATPKEAPDTRVNVAFTHRGMRALGLPDDALQTFPLAFAEGLGATWPDGEPDHRSRLLGDINGSAPSEWEWGYAGGGQRDTAIDALLLVFAADWPSLQDEVRRWTDSPEANDAIERWVALRGSLPEDPDAPVTEPFGFADGLSQPTLKGARGKLRRRDVQPGEPKIDDGEILLGHRDGARQIALSPTVAADDDPGGVLPPVSDGEGNPFDRVGGPVRKDLGFNGTYLVFRQLEQDVDGFNQACAAQSARLGMEPDRFRAMLVGRWPDGSPLMKCPIAPDPLLQNPPAANDFSYAPDPHGERCPMGAHIRRANPRDSLGPTPAASWKVSNRHRILRRGRSYRNDNGQGLHFIGLNADIVRQFEFIQQNWINDATFGGLDGEDDPLAGSRIGHAAAGHLTLPPSPDRRVPRRASGLGRYVTVKGGGYFFLPSLTALRYLAGMPAAPERPPKWQPAPAKLTSQEWVRFLLLARFPILLAFILAALPLALVAGPVAAAIASPMLVVSRPWELAVMTALASLTAAVALITFRIVQLYAELRFGTRTPRPATLTWRRVLTWQAASLPVVATALVRSVIDVGPSWTNAGLFGLAVLSGYALSFFVLSAAAAVRNRNVRPDTRAEALILPLAWRPAERRWLPAWAARIVAAFVRFVESRAATWPPERGAGYVSHDTGRVLPGHVAASVLAVTLFLVYLTGWLGLRPPAPPFGFQLPPMAYLLFVLQTTGWLAASAAFFLDRYRVPLLTAIVAWLVVATVVRGTDHQFLVSKEDLGPAPGIAAAIASADEHYEGTARAGGSNGGPDEPIVVVVAGGGGVRQAAWTVRVLTGLTDLWGDRFAANVRYVGGVSAGSVGAMHFVAEYTPTSPPRGLADGANLQRLVDAVSASSTSEIWWGLAYPDLTRVMLPVSIPRYLPGWLDRGWALEQAWQRALRFDAKSPPTMGQWQRDVAAGWRPAVAFNAMVVETGDRVVLGTYALPGGTATKGIKEITNGRNLPVVTAARLSASFPYVTPFARPSNASDDVENSFVHLTDGGYWDNHSVVSTRDWLLAAKPAIAGRRVLVIQIPPFPDAAPAIGDRAWVWQQTAPLTALSTVRTNAQRERNEFDIGALVASWGGLMTRVEFPYEGRESLGWHLSRADRCDVENAWQRFGQTWQALGQVQGVLGAVAGRMAPLPGECRR